MGSGLLHPTQWPPGTGSWPLHFSRAQVSRQPCFSVTDQQTGPHQGLPVSPVLADYTSMCCVRFETLRCRNQDIAFLEALAFLSGVFTARSWVPSLVRLLLPPPHAGKRGPSTDTGWWRPPPFQAASETLSSASAFGSVADRGAHGTPRTGTITVGPPCRCK